MLYSSIENSKIKNLKKLQLKKYRDKENKFLIEGEHLIKEAYQKNYLKELFVLDGNYNNFDININYITNNVAKYLTELDTPSKIIGVCDKKEGVLKGNKILYLDKIQDPGNLGTIIRSCVAFNIDTLVLSENCVDLYNSKVIRASEGMLFHLNIVIDTNDIIRTLKQKGYKIYGTKVTNGKSLKSLEKREKFVIIMGNEGSGISKSKEELCDEFIYICMNNSCESLNVGVAASIILYELDK